MWRLREEAKGEGEVPDKVNGAAMRLSVGNVSQPANPDHQDRGAEMRLSVGNTSQPANPDLLAVTLTVVQGRDEVSQDARAIS